MVGPRGLRPSLRRSVLLRGSALLPGEATTDATHVSPTPHSDQTHVLNTNESDCPVIDYKYNYTDYRPEHSLDCMEKGRNWWIKVTKNR